MLLATSLGGCGGGEDSAAVTPAGLVETVTVELAQTSATPAASLPTEEPTIEPPPPTDVPSPAPTQRPAAPTPGPPSATAALRPITLTVVALNLRFAPVSLTIPAHVVVTLVMRNEDSAVPHDIGVNIVGGGRTDTCPGPCTSSFSFAAHEPGSYHFFCSLHPEMVGELRVTP